MNYIISWRKRYKGIQWRGDCLHHSLHPCLLPAEDFIVQDYGIFQGWNKEAGGKVSYSESHIISAQHIFQSLLLYSRGSYNLHRPPFLLHYLQLILEEGHVTEIGMGWLKKEVIMVWSHNVID